jgi:hypothetical protein
LNENPFKARNIVPEKRKSKSELKKEKDHERILLQLNKLANKKDELKNDNDGIIIEVKDDEKDVKKKKPEKYKKKTEIIKSNGDTNSKNKSNNNNNNNNNSSKKQLYTVNSNTPEGQVKKVYVRTETGCGNININNKVVEAMEEISGEEEEFENSNGNNETVPDVKV